MDRKDDEPPFPFKPFFNLKHWSSMKRLIKGLLVGVVAISWFLVGDARKQGRPAIHEATSSRSRRSTSGRTDRCLNCTNIKQRYSDKPWLVLHVDPPQNRNFLNSSRIQPVRCLLSRRRVQIWHKELSNQWQAKMCYNHFKCPTQNRTESAQVNGTYKLLSGVWILANEKFGKTAKECCHVGRGNCFDS